MSRKRWLSRINIRKIKVIGLCATCGAIAVLGLLLWIFEQDMTYRYYVTDKTTIFLKSRCGCFVICKVAGFEHANGAYPELTMWLDQFGNFSVLGKSAPEHFANRTSSGPVGVVYVKSLGKLASIGAGRIALFQQPIQQWVLEIRQPLLIVVMSLPCLCMLLWRMRTKSRNRYGCVKCGYNLTGNSSGICPECGRHIYGIRDSH